MLVKFIILSFVTLGKYYIFQFYSSNSSEQEQNMGIMHGNLLCQLDLIIYFPAYSKELEFIFSDRCQGDL